MRKKHLTFEYDSSHIEIYPNILSSARTHVPKWFKDTPPWTGDYPPKKATGEPGGKTVKKCVPFLDALTTGYMVVTAYDIVVSIDEDEFPVVSWSNGGNLIDSRPLDSQKSIPVPSGHHNIQFAWNLPVSVRVPKGYCVLVTNPLNRFDLPFTTLSGVVEGDFVFYETGQLPFYLKQEITGVIPQGTPFIQLIPFKADAWKSERNAALMREGTVLRDRSTAVLENWYRNSIWKRKEYL